METCGTCKYWKPTLYDMGECKQINEKIEIELVTGVDFACNLHKMKG
jgi:hypothetical protein